MSDLLDGLVEGVLETVIDGALELAGHAPVLAEGAARGAGKAYRKGRELGVTGVAAAGALAATTRTRALRVGITPERLRATTEPLLTRALQGSRQAAEQVRMGRSGQRAVRNAGRAAQRLAGRLPKAAGRR